MDDELMYISHVIQQNYSLSLIKLMVEGYEHCGFYPTNQEVPKVLA